MVTGSGIGRERGELHSGLAYQVEAVVVQREVPYDGVVQPLGAMLVVPHVVAAPELAEAIAAGGQFPDQVMDR